MVMSNVVYLGAGEYIGTEKFLRSDFPKKYGDKIIESLKAGYMSPLKEKSLVKQDKERISEARHKDSTFIEVVKVELGKGNSLAANLEVLFKFFFSFHDPTLSHKNFELAGHWADSYIFCSDEAQTAIAEKVREELQGSITNKFCTVFKNDTIATKIGKTRPFFDACLTQQDFMRKHPFHGLKNQKIFFEEWPTAETPTKRDVLKDTKDGAKKVVDILTHPFKNHEEPKQ